MSIESALARSQDRWTFDTTNVEAEQAFIDRTALAAELVKLRATYNDLYYSQQRVDDSKPPLVQISANVAVDVSTVVNIERIIPTAAEAPSFIRVNSKGRSWLISDATFETVLERVNLGRQGGPVPPWTAVPELR